MPNLVETSQWDAGVYQFEVTDPIQGGANGIDNTPHKNLVNRTKWLRDRIAAVVAQGGQTDGTTDNQQLLETIVLHVATTIQLKALPIPTVPGTQTVLVMTRGSQTEGDNLGLFYKWAATDTSPENGLILIPNSNPPAGRWKYVGIDASTFNGLLPNSYALVAQLAAAVAPLAPLNSPGFGGSPTTTTPVAADNSFRIPNTSWVQANYWTRNQPVSQANQLLLAGSGYASFSFGGVAGQPPWLLGTTDGLNVFVWNPANFSVANSAQLQSLQPSTTAFGNSIVARDGNGDAFARYFNGVNPNSETQPVSQFITNNGTDGYFRKTAFATVKAQLGIVTLSDFPASLGVNGFQKLPTGFIFQWGAASVNSGQNNPVDLGISFPTTFPGGCVGVMVATNRSVNSNGQAIDGSNFSSVYSAGSAIITLDSIGGGVNSGRWFAIGF